MKLPDAEWTGCVCHAAAAMPRTAQAFMTKRHRSDHVSFFVRFPKRDETKPTYFALSRKSLLSDRCRHDMHMFLIDFTASVSIIWTNLNCEQVHYTRLGKASGRSPKWRRCDVLPCLALPCLHASLLTLHNIGTS